MIYECRVYSPNGKLKKVHNSKILRVEYWKKFDINPLKNTHYLAGIEEPLKSKSRPHTAQKCRPKPCKWCKIVFTPAHPKNKSCSEKCKKEYLNDYFKKRRLLIKKGLIVFKRRGPSRRKNVPRI